MLSIRLKYYIVTSCVPGTMVIQMKNQTIDIKVLIYQNTQCINILAQAPDTQIVMFVCMTMSRSKIIYNPFYNC